MKKQFAFMLCSFLFLVAVSFSSSASPPGDNTTIDKIMQTPEMVQVMATEQAFVIENYTDSYVMLTTMDSKFEVSFLKEARSVNQEVKSVSLILKKPNYSCTYTLIYNPLQPVAFNLTEFQLIDSKVNNSQIYAKI